MDRILLSGLCKIEWRDGRTTRLCDGGFVTWSGETYLGFDPVFGSLASFDAFHEGVGDEIPALTMTLLPPSSSAVVDITSTSMQGSRVRFWIAEINPTTGAVSGTPDLMGDMQVDRTVLRIGKGKREVDVDVTSKAERLFTLNKGNNLSPSFHKTVNPGELGEDNATGLEIAVAWGVASPSQATSYGTAASPGWFSNRSAAS